MFLFFFSEHDVMYAVEEKAIEPCSIKTIGTLVKQNMCQSMFNQRSRTSRWEREIGDKRWGERERESHRHVLGDQLIKLREYLQCNARF